MEASDVVDEDEDFLLQIQAAEAEALNVKRQKLDAQDVPDNKNEGVYTAALRGSKSLLWQQATFDSRHGKSKGMIHVVAGDVSSPAEGGAEGGSCFKCGKLGHWARDCEAPRGGGEGGFGTDTSVAEKPCPCGLGVCLVLTANTEKNRGRKFYRCPVRQDNGGCGFFEWCDNISGVPTSSGSQSYMSSPSFPDLPCPCGAGSCLVLTAKTGKNIGQQFYRCPANQGNSCGFFKWCNEQTSATGSRSSGPEVYGNFNHANNVGRDGRNGSSCFKCDQEGHWAKDCPAPSSNPPINTGGKFASPGNCFKCNQPGHWARDCPDQDLKVRYR